MKAHFSLHAILFVCLFFPLSLEATTFYVDSESTFEDAQRQAVKDDTIIWRSGTYSDIYLDIEKDHLFITAEELGSTIFTGASRVDIEGDYITFQGFQFIGGSIGTRDVINIRGSHLVFTQNNINEYTCYKYLRVREESQYVEITYCNFENRLNLDDQNILSILVDAVNPGYHKIQYCSFKNFDGIGNDQGIEPIRIGLSTQADRNSRSLVEYCYFTKCNGDGELISSKASQNVYRYNTFEDNPKAELVLRHGSEAIVYGNFFLNGKGGVRVREGQDHYIYNNYFYELDDRAIFLQNEASDPLDNINIAFNTIVDCSEIILGGDGSNKPTDVTFSNNIFSDPDDQLFEEPAGTETWIGNLAFGNLGISQPAAGMEVANPQMVENSAGFFDLTESSPAIDAAQAGYAALPQFEGMEEIDTDLLMDMMQQNRPAAIEERDLGSNEFPHARLIQPIATADNTGPIYLMPMTTSTQEPVLLVNDLLKVYPNPVVDQLQIDLTSKEKALLSIDILDTQGKLIRNVRRATTTEGLVRLTADIHDLPAGWYTIQAKSKNLQSGVRKMQNLKVVKL